jgi:prevent-host-death family protein
MTSIAVRDLRNDTAGVLERVRRGEDVVITVRGVPAARLVPVAHDSAPVPTVSGADFFARLATVQADPGLVSDLERSGSDATDTVGPA